MVPSGVTRREDSRRMAALETAFGTNAATPKKSFPTVFFWLTAGENAAILTPVSEAVMATPWTDSTPFRF